jgi:hypothetical protein
MLKFANGISNRIESPYTLELELLRPRHPQSHNPPAQKKQQRLARCGSVLCAISFWGIIQGSLFLVLEKERLCRDRIDANDEIRHSSTPSFIEQCQPLQDRRQYPLVLRLRLPRIQFQTCR